MTVEISETVTEMRIFCERVGELVLWASAIDAQLTKAVIRACSLTESAMLEPVIAELGTSAKLQILKQRAKHIKPASWSTGIMRWVKKTEKVNSYRNIVAHHQVSMKDGKLILYSPQLRKLLRKIKNQNLTPAKTGNDISEWVKAAKKAFEQGENVLRNFDLLAEKAAKH